MGASLGPVLANIIMTELDKKIVDDLLKDNIIRFYCRYVDDTLILVKPNDIQQVLNKFNSFHKNLQFTLDTFENKIPHFLDLEIHHDGISIYRKETHTWAIHQLSKLYNVESQNCMVMLSGESRKKDLYP